MGGQLHYFGLWVDENFDTGHSKAIPKCTTYNSPQLAGQTEFQVEAIEVWSIQSLVPEASQVWKEIRKYTALLTIISTK